MSRKKSFSALRIPAVLIVVTFAFSCGDNPTIPVSEVVVESDRSLSQYKKRQNEIVLVDLSILARIDEAIRKSDPDLLEDGIRDRLFNELKRLKEEGYSIQKNVAAGPVLHGYPLTWAEFWLLMDYPSRISPTFGTVNDASAEADRQWPGMGQRDTKQDAFRHSYWNVLMSKRISLSWADSFATAHESENHGDPGGPMDLHNNWMGRDIYSRNRSNSESWFSNYLKGYRYIYRSSNVFGPFEYALTYIKQ